jgi:hypothetical protein
MNSTLAPYLMKFDPVFFDDISSWEEHAQHLICISVVGQGPV